MLLHDRKEAGQKLATLLTKYALKKPIIYGIPRGGVIVAAEVAKQLGAPLDILIVRKIGAPTNNEVAIGAVMPDGSAILDNNAIKNWHISHDYIKKAITEKVAEIKSRQSRYQKTDQTRDIEGKTVILVDDGIATGFTIEAAVRGLRLYKPGEVVIAAAVAPHDVVSRLRQTADEVVCLDIPEPFFAVGQFYQDFSQTSDEEVIDAVHEAAKTLSPKT